jgi:glutathione synthase/RimK-type ligase-like ATP-grasp enzyme
MKLGIHNTKGSFSERWIDYCREQQIPFKLIDCYRTDIIDQLADCDALMWHFNHKSSKACKFARQLLYSVTAGGKSVFPDFNTVWHFDDKLGQKYLLESINAPLVPSYAFYDKKEAVDWARGAIYPKVFKLRTGAGSDNVRLVKSKNDAFRLIRKAFGKGFVQYEAWSNLSERFRKYRLGKTNLWDVMKGVIRLAFTTEFSKVAGREKGYIYFQNFIPNNDHDIRVVVIGDKAFAIKRLVRKGDFRASGSGEILYEKSFIDENIVNISFQVSGLLNAQCIAFDYVFDMTNPLIVEISYGFTPSGYDPCPGYWTRDLVWHEGKFNPYGWMVENLVRSAQIKA